MSGDVREERSAAKEESMVGSESSDDTLIVLEFSPKAPAETKEWMMALIKAPGKFLLESTVVRFQLCYGYMGLQWKNWNPCCESNP